MSNNNMLPIQYIAKPIAMHEFGHHVIARLYGFRVGDVNLEITRGGGHNGQAAIYPATDINKLEDAIDYLEKRVIVLLAGAAAQSINFGKVDTEDFDEILCTTASSDYAKIKELLHMLRSIIHTMCDDDAVMQAELTAIEEDLKARCISIVEELHFIIEEAALELTLKIKNYDQVSNITLIEINSLSTIAAKFRS